MKQIKDLTKRSKNLVEPILHRISRVTPGEVIGLVICLPLGAIIAIAGKGEKWTQTQVSDTEQGLADYFEDSEVPPDLAVLAACDFIAHMTAGRLEPIDG